MKYLVQFLTEITKLLQGRGGRRVPSLVLQVCEQLGHHEQVDGPYLQVGIVGSKAGRQQLDRRDDVLVVAKRGDYAPNLQATHIRRACGVGTSCCRGQLHFEGHSFGRSQAVLVCDLLSTPLEFSVGLTPKVRCIRAGS